MDSGCVCHIDSMSVWLSVCVYEKAKMLTQKINIKFPSVSLFCILAANIITYPDLHLFIFRLCVEFMVGPEPNMED